MANGKFHGKRKTGIKITNPLTLPVSVRIKSPTGALHTGDGKETWRTIKPSETLYIPTKGRCEVDIKPSIVRYDEVGTPIKLGDAEFQHVQQPSSGKKVAPPKAGPVMLMDRGDVSNGRWRIIKTWNIPQGFGGLLRAISIQLTGDAEARVELPSEAPSKARQDTTLNYSNNKWLMAGQAVKVKGRSRNGNGGTVDVMIAGELYPVGTPVPAGKAPKTAPEHVTERKPGKEPEEPPLRSLGDMIEDFKREDRSTKKREKVKV
ncbi:hypothetical protein ES703_101991 [subsurface metagenome]